jgi:hypothetical protein
MRPAAILTVAVVAVLGVSVGDAAADKPYASRGVVEVGGQAQLGFSTGSTEVEGIGEGLDSSTTTIRLQPVIGYFVAPRLEIFGGLLLAWQQEDPEAGDSTTTTGIGALAGAGYYVPAGPVFLGPRAQLAYARDKVSRGGSDRTESGPLFQAAGALRVPFGFGGLLDLAAILEYEKLGLDQNGDAVGDTSAFRFGAELGFFLFF